MPATGHHENCTGLTDIPNLNSLRGYAPLHGPVGKASIAPVVAAATRHYDDWTWTIPWRQSNAGIISMTDRTSGRTKAKPGRSESVRPHKPGFVSISKQRSLTCLRTWRGKARGASRGPGGKRQTPLPDAREAGLYRRRLLDRERGGPAGLQGQRQGAAGPQYAGHRRRRGNELYKIQERMLRIKDSMEVEDPNGEQVATVKKALITPGARALDRKRERWAGPGRAGQHPRPRIPHR